MFKKRSTLIFLAIVSYVGLIISIVLFISPGIPQRGMDWLLGIFKILLFAYFSFLYTNTLRNTPK
jgi:hypothetical protein